MGSKKYRNRRGWKKKDAIKTLRRLGYQYDIKTDRDLDHVVHLEDKLSVAIVNVAQPLLDRTDENEIKKDILRLAILAWTAAVVPEKDGGPNVENTLRTICSGCPEDLAVIEADVKFMMERKRMLYPNDRRIPIEFELFEIGNDLKFNVMAIWI